VPSSRVLGELTVVALQDAEGSFFEPRETAFRSATARHWAAADAFDPAARTADGDWWLRFRAFAIRYGDGPVTLVDAGIGPAGAPAGSWVPVPGHLPEELEAAGISAGDVTAIVLTHLHTDHIGWAMPATTPFPEARVVVQRADVEAFAPVRDADLLTPLRQDGRLDIIEGDTALGGGVRALATPGHTPGHQSVLVEDAGESILITGDLLVHAIQLLHPELGYGHDMDADQARVTRQKTLHEATARGSLLAVSHLGKPFCRTKEKARADGPDPSVTRPR
jgi:glyoxylase-like metal-dependent hydrolase (beta-lactamase superfamily II)